MKTYLVIVLSIFSFGLTAQEGGRDLEAEQLEVIKTFDAKLEEATLVDIRPSLPQITPVNKAYNYTVSVVPLKIEYPDPLIRPLAMNDQSEFKSFNHYLELGYGTLNNYQGRLLTSYGSGDRFRINIDGRYFALDNTKEVDFQKMQDIHGIIDGWARLNENVKLDFHAGYEGTERNFYQTFSEGVKTDLFGQSTFNNLVRGGLSISNLTSDDSEIDYEIGNKVFLFFNDALDTREIGYNLFGEISKRRSDRMNLRLPISYDFINLGENVLDALHLQPSIDFNYGYFQANVGVDYVYSNSGVNSIWPEIELSYGLAEGYFQPFIGTMQEHMATNARHMLTISPFLEELGAVRNISLTQKFYAGLRGELNFMSYETEVGYSDIYDQAFFDFQNEIGNNGLMVQYIGDLESLYLKGMLDFKLSKEMSFGGQLIKHFFRQGSDNTLIRGLPSLTGNMYYDYYLLNRKLKLRGDLFLADPVSYTRNNIAPLGAQAIKLNSQVELNASIDYWPLTNIGLQLYGRNLLNNKYQRWAGYPVVGINAGGMLKIKF